MHVLKLSSYVLSVTMLLLAPIESAKAQRYGQPTQPHYGQGRAQQNVETIYANTYLQVGERVNLTRMLNLAPGQTLEQVKVMASSSDYDAKLVMKVNGQRVDAAPVDYYSSQKTFQVPSMTRATDEIVLIARKGAVYIGQIDAVISQSYGQGPGQADVYKARLNLVVRGHSIIKVLKEVKSQNQVRLRGLDVKKVIMRAQALGRGHRAATAQLLVNDMPIGAPEVITSGKIVFRLSGYGPQTIGREIRKIQVAITGKAEVQMIGLRVKEDHGRHYPQVVTSRVNRTFYGSERISLAQLMGRAQVPMGAKVASVTIVAEGRGKIVMTGAGMVMGHMRFDYYSNKVQTLSAPSQVSAAAIMLRVRGPLTIESVEVKLTR